ncbi:MAG: DUF6597 domain-containing transcriptional factor [Planctomycetaceae bacterium]
MIYHAISPEPPLDRFVESVFHLKGYQPEHSIERLVPDTRASLVIELDGQERWIADNETLKPVQMCRGSWVSGPHRRYFSISALANTELLAVQFRVGGLFPLVQSPIDEITDRVVDAQQLLGDSIVELRENLIRTESSEDKVRLAEQWLIRKMDVSLSPPTGIQQAIEAIVTRPSLETLSECITDSGYSQKHVIHLFKKHVGYRPKDLQRVIRFAQAMAAIQAGEPIEWAMLSAECGYSDQSHFIRDFKHFSGFTPTGFQDVGTDRVNFIPIKDEPG